MDTDREAAGSWVGRSVPRLDGGRFVAGEVRYAADLIPPDAFHVALVRSPHARARILAVETEEARGMEGVVAVVDGVQAESLAVPMPMVLPFLGPGAGRPILGRALAARLVSFAGQPVAAVVAESPHAADAAARRVIVRYEALETVQDTEAALAEGAPVVHEGWTSNLVATDHVRAGEAAAVLRGAPHVVRGELHLRPSTAAPMEPLCYIGDWETRTGRLTLTGTFQNPHASRWLVATALGLRESDLRVVAPAMGGTFGYKMSGHTEEALVGLLSRLLGRPVAYVESRRDCFLGHCREQHHRFEIAADGEGRILAFRDTFVADVGTIGPGNGWTMPLVAATVFPTLYDVPNVEVSCTLVATNKAPWQPVRGYGKEVANLVMERAVDLLAAELRLDPAELRARNLLRRADLPRRLPSGLNLDSGDYPEALTRLKALFGYDAWRARQAAAADGRRIGIGIGCELTPEGGARPGAFPSGFETASIRMSPTGDVQVAVGVTSPGSGNETGIAQLVGGVLGLTPAAIRVVQGDTDAVPVGTGNASSRAILYGGAAAHLAAVDLRAKLAACAANLLQAPADEITFAEGRACAPSGASVTLAALALGAHTHPFTVADGVELPLEATRSYRARNIRVTPDANGRIATYSSFPYSMHAVAVELDPGTGRVTVLDVAAVHDCGVMINPALVTGQLKGAIVMGLGAALWEELTQDGEGRLVSDRFKTYLLPRATDLPTIRVDHMATPSPFHPLGMKGAGESGLGGALAAATNAVADALGALSPGLTTVPATPPRLMALLARGAAR
ncbi:xanthine dehydrogenase family protein molybdopterin-binding subunit [Pararoseomonas indoligenes]|uniref:Xanthine dehydrogenase family protein n=1 Tax=Roseomonas indoligenes TaxID=2820811 RepID=A0A940N6J9_9PROT|nr:xanthine dehydrogenase family protein molybdopterin-binding subunit [Pararoseomonas indoligenes]MBP0495052.1 xanthine dehydrogenase family protein [Pararoseomonas indoligenes]